MYNDAIICTYIKGASMIELGISQAQAQFTKLLNQTVIIVDKRAHLKKAVILPYEEYEKMMQQCTTKESLMRGSFDKFAGILNDEFSTDDQRYNKIVK